MKEKVRDILQKESFYDGELTPELLLNETLGIDSLRIVNVLLELEETFGILIGEEDMEPKKLMYVQDIYDLAERYVS